MNLELASVCPSCGAEIRLERVKGTESTPVPVSFEIVTQQLTALENYVQTTRCANCGRIIGEHTQSELQSCGDHLENRHS